MGAALAYGPYPKAGALGLVGAGEVVRTTAGWKTPARELISEFNQDQRRAPTADEIAVLNKLAKRANAILVRPNITAGHPSREDEMDWNTAHGLINFYLVHDRGPDNGDPVAPPRGPETDALIRAAVHAVPDKKSWINQAISSVEHTVSKIPVVGDVTHIVGEIAVAPLHIATAIASGERLDHVALGALKDQIKIVKDVAPYAQTVVSLVPGVGTGVGAAIGMGAALAEGQSITAAAKSAIRGALPGGALAASGFDLAMKVASGENVAKATLESARGTLPPEAQKAYDIGVAVATGEKIQTALVKGIASAAPAQLQTAIAAGEQAIGATPGLADALKSVPAGDAAQGFKLAAGLLSHAAVGEPVLTAARSNLSPAGRQGFDAALQTQTPHTAWVANVAPLKILEPTKRKTPPTTAVATARAPAYGPYPKIGTVSAPPHGGHGGGGHGHGGGHHGPGGRPIFRGGARGPGWWWDVPYSPQVVTETETCRTWSDPITMPPEMDRAARVALNVSQGRPTTVRGPDNVLYQFAIENGVMTARACAVTGTLSDTTVKDLWSGVGAPPTYGPYP